MYDFTLCDAGDDFVFPIYEYEHSFSTGGFSITGGFVYRGTEFPGMVGYYIFADYVTGNFWQTTSDGLGGFSTEFLGNIQSDISSFGEDVNGELYACNLTSGQIYHVIDQNCGPVWGVEVADLTATTATVVWRDTGSPKYRFSYKKPGTPFTKITTTTEEVNLAGLTPSTLYSYSIKSVCPGEMAIYTKNGSFTTPPLKLASWYGNNPFIQPIVGDGLFSFR